VLYIHDMIVYIVNLKRNYMGCEHDTTNDKPGGSLANSYDMLKAENYTTVVLRSLRDGLLLLTGLYIGKLLKFHLETVSHFDINAILVVFSGLVGFRLFIGDSFIQLLHLNGVFNMFNTRFFEDYFESKKTLRTQIVSQFIDVDAKDTIGTLIDLETQLERLAIQVHYVREMYKILRGYKTLTAGIALGFGITTFIH